MKTGRKNICLAIPIPSCDGRQIVPVLDDIVRLGTGWKIRTFVATNNSGIDEDSWKILEARQWVFFRASTTMTEPMFQRWFYSLFKSHPADITIVIPPGAFLLDGFFEKAVSAWEEVGDPAAALCLAASAQSMQDSTSAKVRPADRGFRQAWLVGPSGTKRLASWNPETHGPAETLFDKTGIWQVGEGLVSMSVPSLVFPDAPGTELPVSRPLPSPPPSLPKLQEGTADARNRLRNPVQRPEPPAVRRPVAAPIPVPEPEPPRKAPGTAPGKASFLVATHHRPRLLRAALGLLLAQETPPNWKWDILVGGVPDDPGREVVKEFPGIRWVDCPGPSVTTKLNTLLATTDAELVMKADDDDLQPPDRLKAAAEAHENGAQISGSGNIVFYSLDDDRAMEWVGRAALGLVGTSMSFDTVLLRMAGGWPDQTKGEDGVVMSRIRQLRPNVLFSDLSGKMGVIVGIQHGGNIHQRPSVEKGTRTSRGGFSITGLGTLAEAGFSPSVRRAIQTVIRGLPDTTAPTVPTVPKEPPRPAIFPTPVSAFGERPLLLTCTQGQFGQLAFIDGLRSVGFQAVGFEEAKKQVSSGNPVLFHGWRDQYAQLGRKHPGLVAVLWHSGWTGSDLMGEGKALAEALVAAREGHIRLLWLERRDAIPPEAIPVAPIWSPSDMKRFSSGAGKKRPRSVMVAFHGAWSATCKNDLAGIAACAAIPGTELHVSKCAFEGPRGATVKEILRNAKCVVHDQMSREQAVRLMSEMEVVCHPSISDTWPYAVLESVHCGTPVVTSSAVSWTEALPDWARKLCVPSSPTATGEIRTLVRALLDSPENRKKLLEAQQETLISLLKDCQAEFFTAAGKAGFPVSVLPARDAVKTEKHPAVMEVLIDSPDWAFDRIIGQLQSHLKMPFKKACVKDGGRIDHGIVFWWKGHLKHVRNPEQSLLAVYDLLSWDRKTAANVFSQFKVIGTANRELKEKLRDIPELDNKSIHVLADGVDVKMFTPDGRIEPGEKIRAGWAGNLEWGGKGADHKGAGILEAVMAATEDICEWAIVDRKRNPKTFDEMPDFYRKIDLITCFSDMEGTPNPVLEGAACGCLPLTTNVGIVPELADTGAVVEVVERDASAFIRKIRELHADRKRLKDAARINPGVLAEFWDWSVRVLDWRDALDDLEGVRGTVPLNIPRRTLLDLRDKVTVFVSTVGAPDFKECLARLETQDCRVGVKVIRNVAPMSAAFQKMINDCDTPFYVQVDEDMLLDPDAVRLLYEGISRRSEKMAIFFRSLRDRFTGFNLVGVKIYRHAAMVTHPYDPRDFSCEVDQVERLRKDGWLVDGESPGLRGDPKKCVGDLNAYWTPWGVFEKYFRDLQKHKLYPVRQEWMKTLPEFFLERLIKNPKGPLDVSAFSGTVAGMMSPTDIRDGEKDFRDTSRKKAFEELAKKLGIDPNKTYNLR